MTVIALIILYLAMGLLNMMLFIIIEESGEFETDCSIFTSIILWPIIIIPYSIFIMRMIFSYLISDQKNHIKETWTEAFKKNNKRNRRETWE